MSKLAILVVLVLITGCNNENPDTKEKTEVKEYSVAAIDETQLEKIITDRKGKTLFINVWATWCAPCVEEFPDLVRVAEHFGDKDVDFLSLNVDFSSHIDSLVIPFLKHFNTNFTVYNVREKNSEKVINLLNPAWSGAIPATFIYDKYGRQMVFILGSDKFETFRATIDSVRRI